jgi:outer membrane receptor for ferrienterochelin and colicin
MRNLLRISILSLFLTPFAFSQELTSDLTGSVNSDAGSVEGAQVTITYEPTNTVVTKVTGSNGKFNAGGLRPGGPYTIVVSAPGLTSQEVITTLIIGETERLNFNLASSVAADIEELVVTGSKISTDSKSGYTTIIDSETIANQPSVTRDLTDLLRLNPLVSVDNEEDGEESFTIGGAHNRTNDIKVDGVSFNDDFGLNSNGYPSQRSPLNFNSIEQLAVKVAPVSVEYSQFRGGVIDIVTKGGTNEFHGDISYFDRGDSLMGDSLEGQPVDISKDDTAIELSLGGPIIKDELFFFFTYAEAEIANPLEYGIIGSGAENILDITEDQVNQIRSTAQSLIGIDPLQADGATTSFQENTTLRLDWNINDMHRLTYNYKDVSGNQTRGDASNRDTLSLYSARYIKTESTTTNSLHLVSDLSDNLISEFYYSTKETMTDQISPSGQNMPFFEIGDAFGYTIRFGPDIYRHANDLDTETTFFKGKLTYYLNDHKITAGYENTLYDTYNVFIQNEDGSFEFDNLADFEAGIIGDYSASGSKTGIVSDAAADFEYELSSFYLMDEYTVSDRMVLTAGIRYDDYSGDDTPTNQSFLDEYGFKNGGIKGTDLVNIRFGLDYIIDDVSDINITLGTYSSKMPNVWISNAYTNTGVNIANYDEDFATSACDTSTFGGLTFSGSNTKPDCVISSISNPLNTSGKVDFIAPSFKWPESRIFNLTYNRLLPGDANLTLTYLNSREEEALYRMIDTGYPLIGDQPTVPTETAPDGRPIYNQTGKNGYNAGLYNQCCGNREVLSATFSKAFRDGDTLLSLSYTAQDAEQLSGMTSSTSNSNYGKVGAVDYNNRQVGRSIYEVQHRFLATLSSKHYFFGDNATTFNLFYGRESGQSMYPVFDTYTSNPSQYRQRAWGHDFQVNDDNLGLLYIPTYNDPLVCWSSGCENEGTAEAALREQEVLVHLYNVWGLEGYAGQISPRDAGSFPWQTTLDFSLVQELPGIREGDQFIVTFAIDNLLNLIDEDKGIVRYGYYSGRVPVIDLKIIDNTRFDYSRNAFRHNFSDPFNIDRSTTQSLWRASLGFQYKF